MIRPAKEMSRFSTCISAARAKLWIMGKSEALASSGASSTVVYKMSGNVELAIFLHL
jgi:hypothetical protein